jgi:hypothetical protein
MVNKMRIMFVVKMVLLLVYSHAGFSHWSIHVGFGHSTIVGFLHFQEATGASHWILHVMLNGKLKQKSLEHNISTSGHESDSQESGGAFVTWQFGFKQFLVVGLYPLLHIITQFGGFATDSHTAEQTGLSHE